MYSRAEQLNRNTRILVNYIHPLAAGIIAEWIIEYDFKLKIKKERRSRMGDYRPALEYRNHVITINRNLNPHAFLITLVHEVAHLKTFITHGATVLPHGIEWKACFSELMRFFMHQDVFPPDVLYALNRYIKNPAASSCSDLTLHKVLYSYNKESSGYLLDSLPEGTLFYTKSQHAFIKGPLQRTRFLCKEQAGRRSYLFPAGYEVFLK